MAVDTSNLEQGIQSLNMFTEGFHSQSEPTHFHLAFDENIWKDDVKVSRAYAKALLKADLITLSEHEQIQNGLSKVFNEWADGQFVIKQEDGDVHKANERRFLEIVGLEAAAKLQLGLSNFEQNVTILRMWLLDSVKILIDKLNDLIRVFCYRAQKDINIIIPCYMNMKKWRPVRWSDWLMSHAWFMQQDLERLCDMVKRIDILPLGCGFIAGTVFEIDLNFLAEELGFSSYCHNSMTSAADRDFIAEFLFWAALFATHLSRFSEDLIIYSSQEFGFIKIPDEYCTASHFSPRKRNSCSVEMIRAISGKTIGNFMGFQMVMKGLPMHFTQDLEEGKNFLFRSYEYVLSMIKTIKESLLTMKINKTECRKSLNDSLLVYQITDYLTIKGVEPHLIAKIEEKIKNKTEKEQIKLKDMVTADFRDISSGFEDDFDFITNFELLVELSGTQDGSSKKHVQIQIIQMMTALGNQKV